MDVFLIRLRSERYPVRPIIEASQPPQYLTNEALRRYWYIGARSVDLRGRPLGRVILGKRIVLFRNRDGQPAALADRCAHRGMALSEGTVRERGVQCSYHGWTYNRRGECVEIPAAVEPSGLIGRQMVYSYPVVEHQGFVWVYMGDDEPSRDPAEFAHLGERGWTSFTMRTRFRASVFNCLENFLDVPHTEHVHRRWFRTHTSHEVTAKVECRTDGVSVSFEGEPALRSVVGKLLRSKSEGLAHTDRFIMPNISRVDYKYSSGRHFIITSQCTPISEDETEVFTVITFRVVPWGRLVRLFFEPLSKYIIKQDVQVLERQARQIRTWGDPRFVFAETDLIGPHITRLWSEAGRAGSADVNVAEQTILIRI